MKPQMPIDPRPPGDAEPAPIAVGDMGHAMVLELLLRRLPLHTLRMHLTFLMHSLCAPPAATLTISLWFAAAGALPLELLLPGALWSAGLSVTGKAKPSPSSKHAWNSKMLPTLLKAMRRPLSLCST